jgi:phage-related tail protein
MRAVRHFSMLLTGLLAASVAAHAQQMPTPEQLQEILQQVQQNPDHMQRMMQQAADMQACFAKLDQTTMDGLRARGEAMAADVQQLCAAGKRDDATQLAVRYAQEMSGSPELQSIQQCGQLAQSMVADLPFGTPGQADGPAHVCDQLPQQ